MKMTNDEVMCIMCVLLDYIAENGNAREHVFNRLFTQLVRMMEEE